MKVCYFGFYSPNYSRNHIIKKGLRENGVEVIECNSRAKGFKKYIDLIIQYSRIKKDYDFMIVGFPGYQAVILARFLTRKKIVFDAFTSIYDSIVFDRKTINKKSIKAFYYFLLDWTSCRLADKVLLDTNEHIDYFINKFKVKKNKFIRVLVGSDGDIIKENLKNEHLDRDYFLIHFHGTFIPLQGVEYIIKAAKLLERENIKFNIIGKGQTYKKIIKLKDDLNLNNINFIDSVPYERLGEYIAKADICLGIFGNTKKAIRVIPNKIYEYMVVGRPFVTAKTRGVEEILIDGENVLFCNIADEKDLADKILKLKNDKELRDKIAKNANKLFNEKLTPKILVKKLITELNIK